MIIYSQEKADGLEELLLSKASVKFDSIVKPELNLSKASVKNQSKDLFGIESILVSVGWNSNDDVFDRIELWRARATPINKKFNFMHNEKDIIGHITKAFVLDKDGNIIPDDTKEEDLPDFFEIGVHSVLYKIWEDKDLQERASTLMHEIAEGKWFVSMEVYFPAFDYALTKGDEQKIIERNEETSFLTKYLRIYNGKGEYEGWKVGRKIKDMFFSGKGLVNKPANERSLITSFNFNGAKASVSIFDNEVKMSVEQKDYDKAVAELGATKKDLDSVTKENDLLKKSVASLEADLESSKALASELKEQVSKLNEEKEQRDTKLAEVNKALADVLGKVKSQERLSKLLENGVDKADAEKVVEKFAKASDEMFDEVVALKKVVKTNPKEAANQLDNAQASAGDHIEQESEVNESDKLLELSVAYVKDFFQRKEGDK